MKKIKNIIIANDAEAFSFIINNIENLKKREEKINKEHFLSSRFLFWEGDDKIVITPISIQTGILDNLKNVGYRNIENWYPKKISISLSDAIRSDKELFSRLENVVKNNPGIVISPYSFTKELAELTNDLRQKNLLFSVDQEPKKNFEWLIDYLGSKVGFRIEYEKLQLKGKLPSSNFFVCGNKEEVINTSLCFFENKKPFVIKASVGEGGWGVLIVDCRKYISSIELRSFLTMKMNSDSIWSAPFIVEEFIDSVGNDQKSPSIEIYVGDNSTKITYICNQIVDATGKFIGIIIGKNSVRKNIQTKIYKIAHTIADHYMGLGYKGFFDIDFIVSKNGKTYPVETNVRRTGGTHVFDLTKFVYGSNWDKKITALSCDSFVYGKSVLSADAINKSLREIAFPIKNKREGVIIIAVANDKPLFSFVVFGQDKNRVNQIYSRLTKIFKNE